MVSEFELRGMMRKCNHPLFPIMRAFELSTGLNYFTGKPLSPPRETRKMTVEELLEDAKWRD